MRVVAECVCSGAWTIAPARLPSSRLPPGVTPRWRRSGRWRRDILAGLLLAKVLGQLVAQRPRVAVLGCQPQQGITLRRRLREPALLGQGGGKGEVGVLEIGSQAHRGPERLDGLGGGATLRQDRAELQAGA